MTEEAENNTDAIIELTADIVSAYVSKNPVPLGELPALIGQVHAALKGTVGGSPAEPEALKPAVPIKKSVTPDYIISLEDGKKFKSLKRHLSTHYGLTPDEYRAKWGLPADYPMVAPNYAAARSALAKTIGLGRKPKEPEQPAPAKRTRKKAAA
ncbi:MAG: MucR family transcriptional regulator [Mesorhizobium sp.]|uniref:MucR family transcriptional regulator n=1 Tax=unclassified Mesorhizobium TaxID=325217 RepID=UPI000FC9EECC|nr:MULTISPECIES: MucR family transcriptional regulator [unclassified Mesorhizobium]RUU25157.1 MucR family transcriptional regulator [Mesorhizobium sp. M6A.T.Ce.TU.016.01.1.1]RWE07639.1 MAG: MucR family transcriptional regulator [Mesorhizobium sp.]RWP54414.1 MAG: MucR family transcriptional regulator [Mesorhizobium sp.]